MILEQTIANERKFNQPLDNQKRLARSAKLGGEFITDLKSHKKKF